MWTPNELEALNLLHYSPVNENRGVLGPLFPVVHNHLLCLAHIEGEVAVLAPNGQVSDLLSIGGLVVDQAYHCCVIGKCNDLMISKISKHNDNFFILPLFK